MAAPSEKPLTAFQKRVLHYAQDHGGVYGFGNAARALDTNNPNLSRSVRLLIARGYLWKTYRSEITDKGREAIA